MIRSLLLPLFTVLSLNALKAQHSPCAGADSIRIVVIGSSTAAGAGASTSDSAWVNRYRHYLQSINAANEVINLARGGYNTWRLMPDNFNPPSNRPSPDTLRNISHALRQNPDGIIINLPSNDAAIGTGVNEQMSNFIHMDSVAKAAGIPVWVCTTQPRNFGSTQINIQLGVRDSVKSYFGSRALDFWTPLANVQSTIDSLYNSGDGVHVNNWGHRLLFQVAQNAAIIDSLVVGRSGIDLRAFRPSWLNPSRCGSAQSQIELSIANLGQDSLNGPANLALIREDLATGVIDTFQQSISSLQGCQQVSVVFTLNSAGQTNWQLTSHISHPSDSNLQNNISAHYELITLQQPSLNIRDTVACGEDSLRLSAYSNQLIRWFSDPDLLNSIHEGDSVTWPSKQGDTLYLRSYLGPFVYFDQLPASPTHNIKWNGCMFNLIAGADTVFLDSIRFTAGNTADLQVNLCTKTGAYQGFEGSPSAWSPAFSDSVYQAQEDSLYFLNFGTISINPFDTLGCYLYLENSSHRLAYQWANSNLTNSSAGLSLEAGSGISHTFGSTFSPRHFAGEFHYHYGYNPEGQCQSDIDTLIIYRSQATLQIGNDTVLMPTNSLTLQVPSGFSVVSWSDGTSADSLIIPYQGNAPSGSRWVWLDALDSLGCLHRDSVNVRFSGLSIIEQANAEVAVYPNPSDGQFQLKCKITSHYKVQLYSLRGELLSNHSFTGTDYKLKTHLPKGIYLLKVESEEFSTLRKVLIE